MSNPIVSASAWSGSISSTIRTAAIVAAGTMLAAAASDVALAQTPRTTPKPQPDLFQTPDATKSAPVKQTKSCSSLGDGFVNVPGSDTCVKAGGYMRMDAGGSR
jgi:hypothetical protein